MGLPPLITETTEPTATGESAARTADVRLDHHNAEEPTAAGLMSEEPKAAGDDSEQTDTRTAGAGRFRRTISWPGFRGRDSWSRVLACAVLPAVALMLAAIAGWLKWQAGSDHTQQGPGAQAVQAARESAVALLSYHADTVDKDLGAARDRLTGNFRDAYTSLTHDVVIPGAKEKHISAAATVPAAALVSATDKHAVVLLAVNQTVTIGSDTPSDTASSVRVTLDKVGGHWLIGGFDPV